MALGSIGLLLAGVIVSCDKAQNDAEQGRVLAQFGVQVPWSLMFSETGSELMVGISRSTRENLRAELHSLEWPSGKRLASVQVDGSFPKLLTIDESGNLVSNNLAFGMVQIRTPRSLDLVREIDLRKLELPVPVRQSQYGVDICKDMKMYIGAQGEDNQTMVTVLDLDSLDVVSSSSSPPSVIPRIQPSGNQLVFTYTYSKEEDGTQTEGESYARVAVLDRETLEVLLTRDLPGAVHPATFSPDGKWFAARSDDNIFVFETKSWKIVKRFGERSLSMGLAFSPSSRLLAIGDGEGIVDIWDTESWKSSIAWRNGGIGISCIAFAPDEMSVVTGDIGGNLRAWRIPQ